jgi:hypothetical protein
MFVLGDVELNTYGEDELKNDDASQPEAVAPAVDPVVPASPPEETILK